MAGIRQQRTDESGKHNQARPQESTIDPVLAYKLDRLVVIILVAMLLAIIFIPGSWLNSASMWCRDHLPGF